MSDVRARIRHQIAKFALSLPPSLQTKIAGKGKPVVVDGLTLHPELQMMFWLQKLVGARSLTDGEAAQCRRRVRREALEQAGRPTPVGAVRDVHVGAGSGARALPARHYAPVNAKGNEPLLVYFHGGGFVVGDLDTADSGCRVLCRHGGVHVLSIDYRLAPEHPFPAAFEDALASFQWACDNAASLGADATRVGVGGDSAGAHLSAVLSTYLVHRGARAPHMQLLLYPAIDREVVRPSVNLFAEGFLLEKRDIERFQHWYTGHLTEPDPHGRATPLAALEHPKGLKGHPASVLVTAGFDPLRDEGEEYGRHLEDAGNTVVMRRFDDLVHGFTNLVGISRASREALVEVAGVTRAVFESAPAHSNVNVRASLRSIA